MKVAQAISWIQFTGGAGGATLGRGVRQQWGKFVFWKQKQGCFPEAETAGSGVCLTEKKLIFLGSLVCRV